jgi:hypothetical protein
MQSLKVLGTLLAVCLPVTLSAGEPPGKGREIMLFGAGQEDGSMTEYVVSKRTAEDSPAWNPETEDPPLSIARAVALAKEHFLFAHPKFDGAKLSDVSLRPIGDYEARDRWFYSITFHPIIDGQSMHGWNAPVVLLMDGTLAQTRKGERWNPD